MSLPIRSLLATPVAALAACLFVTACGPKPPPAPPPPTVSVARPLQMTVVDWDDYVGQFVAVNSVDVRPRVSGYLVSVGFRDGDIVKQGQVLFSIDPRPYAAVLAQAKGQEAHAEAALANARADLARGDQLLAAKAISQQAHDALLAAERQDAADLQSAHAQVATAALNVSFTRVTAPLTGRVSDRRVAPGNLVTADTTVLTNIVDLNPIRFAFTGSEAAYLKYERENPGATRGAVPVEIRLQDEPDYRWKGRLDFLDNAIDTSSGTIRGRAVVDNPSLFLAPGMFGHMRLQGSQPYPALLIPDQAIVTDQTRQVVYVVGRDGTVSERAVVPGPLVQGLRVIRQGLNPADIVIIDGVQRARPGQKVSPKTSPIALDPAAEAAAAAYAPPPAGSASIVGAGPTAQVR